jgi:ribosomal peptide maturation radical SAM protein 1
MRDAATNFVDRTARQILELHPGIVGCSSTFLQTTSSLALLKRIRELDPSIVTMIGGANCEGIMGEATHRCFPWVDYVVSGEADHIIAGLVERILSEGKDLQPEQLPPSVLGPAHRSGSTQRTPIQYGVIQSMDGLPFPEYADFMEQVSATSFAKAVTPGLLMETSRGCWWGQKNKCTFCGLNLPTGTYRTKSPERVIEEISFLKNTYQIKSFEMTDNIIDMDYFKRLLPAIQQEFPGCRFFYESKANLTRSQVMEFRNAGVRWVQPGIESLHTDALKLMNKGIQAWQNLLLLRHCREFGIRLSWNFLWGFPGEKEEWYSEMADWIPLIEHLQPPNGLISIRLQRNSHYFEQAEQYGLELHPHTAMFHLFCLPEADLMDLSFSFLPKGWFDCFSNRVDEKLKGRAGIEKLYQSIAGWRKNFWRWNSPILAIEDMGDRISVLDTRSCARECRYELCGLQRKLYLLFENAPTSASIPESYAARYGEAYPAEEAETAIRGLLDWGIVLKMDGRMVGLGVPGDNPHLTGLREFPGGHLNISPAAYGFLPPSMWQHDDA